MSIEKIKRNQIVKDSSLAESSLCWMKMSQKRNRRVAPNVDLYPPLQTKKYLMPKEKIAIEQRVFNALNFIVRAGLARNMDEIRETLRISNEAIWIVDPIVAQIT